MAEEDRDANWTGSATAAGTGLARKPIGPVGADTFDFNLQVTMAKVLKNMDEKVPSTFKKFYSSHQYQRMVCTFLLYFTAIFQREWIIQAMEKSRKQHLEGYNPHVAVARMRELEEEQKSLQAEISQMYSGLILKFACYEKPQQDKMFFETLYDTLICIVDDAFSRLGRRADIEAEVGTLFRSRHFNMYKRKNMPPRSVDTLGVKELYAIKNESSNRILNARMLSSLFEKPPSTGITVASVTNSPLISNYISSPSVSRALMKDPEARESMYKQEKKEQAAAAGVLTTEQKVGAAFRTAALVRGVDIKQVSQELEKLEVSDESKAAVGIIPAAGAYKADRARPVHGVVAPETVGLPLDDTINYLALLRRYIVHGPGLGLKDGQGATSEA